jgi:uroporphyrin-III C-methyltransferase/precorrin-2 dehydrogenase/sirohydrochlorin ferrochelatase
VSQRSSIAGQLIRGGLAQHTPVAVIESAWTDRQRVTRSTLIELEDLDVSSPAIIVVGPTAALALRDIMSETAALTR